MALNDVLTLFRSALMTALALAGPILAFGLVTGLLVSIIQAATQVHELTLTFVPKIAAVVLCLVLFLPWMLQKLIAFTALVFEYAGRMGLAR